MVEFALDQLSPTQANHVLCRLPLPPFNYVAQEIVPSSFNAPQVSQLRPMTIVSSATVPRRELSLSFIKYPIKPESHEPSYMIAPRRVLRNKSNGSQMN